MAEAPLTLLLEYLDSNAQPTFVAHLSHTDHTLQGAEQHSIFAHTNPALSRLGPLHTEVVERLQRPDDSDLIALGRPSQTGRNTYIASFCGIIWAVTIVGSKWLIAVSTEEHYGPNKSEGTGSSQVVHLTNAAASIEASVPHTPATSNASASLAKTNGQKLLLGAVKPNGHLCDLAYLEWMRQYDWASSPVGPVDEWPVALRHTCELALATSDPINIVWGDECTLLYNQAYSGIVGDKHPRAMGRPLKENFPQWPEYHRMFDEMKRTGQYVEQEKQRRILVRDGISQECFFSFLLAPILDADGFVVGYTTRIIERTRQIVSERRIQILADTNQAVATMYTTHDLCAAAAAVLDKHTSDIQFAAIYSTQAKDDTLEFVLEATAGMSKEVRGAAKTGDLGTVDFGLHRALLDACTTRELITLSIFDDSLSQTTLKQLEDHGAQPSREIVIHPLKCFVEDSIAAVMVIGTGPLRKFDEDYRSFLRLLTRQIENGINVAKGIIKEQETHRKQLASELDRRFWRFAQDAPVGVYMFNSEDVLTFCNTAFEEICGISKETLAEPKAWMEMVHPDGVANMLATWKSYTDSRHEGPLTFEAQFKKPWASKGDGAKVMLDRTYALGILQPEYSDDGRLKGTLGCITDISSVKWAEKMQSAQLSEAIEQKRQQENFLDVTSHEMRNPLNAIFQCAYELTENIKFELDNCKNDRRQAEALSESLDLAITITYCANHQKRIVDDILTLSKLDARLLQIYPESTNPIRMFREIIGLFAPEIRASGMNTNFMVAEGYNRLDLKGIMIDPNRVTQIVINLLSNAIKFTKKGKKRDLEMTLNAHLEEPANKPLSTEYVISGDQHQDPTNRPEWGQGEVIYLSFSVKDSGLGMTPEEASNLFKKFAQASPRTHTQFGGSGLGLYISRNLAELHGGRIGLRSQAGFGSTFEFYVKVRRSEEKELPITPLDKFMAGHELHRTMTSPAMQQAQPLDQYSPGVETPLPPSSRVNVLVVEDNLINQRLLCKLITKHGYDTTTANNGEEALAFIASSTWNPVHTKKDSDIVPTIDIVLCDIEMPIMDGKTCARRVRQLQQEHLLTHYIPMIAITGNARLEQVEEMRQCGFNDVVTKPYQIDQLLRIIERHVRKRDEYSDTEEE
ncbi:hypothetical protein C7974DRAFT_13853 [Boeremia exigua]|uniref:uncharacterized protein n=1 Tax=Boeremia exigua TaxID=749465 RepID=UPI001E8DA87B|nr:uncharacterized protein C7974DRAFT_13853 [Boeremia exigua]KAH6644071.1 hypothetical protein C7974DRAFT_13853 [Boeremia exigua]